jgi:NADPH-dependent curcumin reductase CurA
MRRRVREVVLARPVPDGARVEDFEIVERDLPPRTPAGMVHVRPLWLALDPYVPQALRGRHLGAPAPARGEPLPGECVGIVLSSGVPGFAAGDHVVGHAGWAEEAIVPADRLRNVDPALGTREHLGVLGMPGLTAWAGMTQLASVGPDDLVCVDAAAGAVGGTAGQIAKLYGARVAGIAGGPEKTRLVTDVYGFDSCIDYRQGGWETLIPADISLHFENVGQRVLDAVIPRLRAYGQIILCGLAQHYADGSVARLPLGLVMAKRAIVRGLIVYDFEERRDEWIAFAAPRLKEGRLVEAHDVVVGLESAAAQLVSVAGGRTIGRPLVRIAG